MVRVTGFQRAQTASPRCQNILMFFCEDHFQLSHQLLALLPNKRWPYCRNHPTLLPTPFATPKKTPRILKATYITYLSARGAPAANRPHTPLGPRLVSGPLTRGGGNGTHLVRHSSRRLRLCKHRLHDPTLRARRLPGPPLLHHRLPSPDRRRRHGQHGRVQLRLLWRERRWGRAAASTPALLLLRPPPSTARQLHFNRTSAACRLENGWPPEDPARI